MEFARIVLLGRELFEAAIPPERKAFGEVRAAVWGPFYMLRIFLRKMPAHLQDCRIPGTIRITCSPICQIHSPGQSSLTNSLPPEPHPWRP